jgi:aryl-alcohol dehydrogenase-like predicted oxidoreductase
VVIFLTPKSERQITPILHDLLQWSSTPTGKIDEKTKFDSTDFRNTVPRFSPEARKANQALVDLIGEFSAQKKATPAQIALAWVLAETMDRTDSGNNKTA